MIRHGPTARVGLWGPFFFPFFPFCLFYYSLYNFAYITKDGGAGWGGLVYDMCGEWGEFGTVTFWWLRSFHVRIMGKNILDYYF